MDENSEIEIVERVIARMDLPFERSKREHIDTLGGMEWALKKLSPFSPKKVSLDAMRLGLQDYHPTGQEYLQAWALYMDYKFMALSSKGIPRF